MVSCFSLKFLIHVELIFVYYMTGVSFYSFACECPVFPTPFIEEAAFSPLYILAFFVIVQPDHTAGYFRAACSVPLVCVSGFVLVPLLFWLL